MMKYYVSCPCCCLTAIETKNKFDKNLVTSAMLQLKASHQALAAAFNADPMKCPSCGAGLIGGDGLVTRLQPSGEDCVVVEKPTPYVTEPEPEPEPDGPMVEAMGLSIAKVAEEAGCSATHIRANRDKIPGMYFDDKGFIKFPGSAVQWVKDNLIG